ncbi:MAG: prepilin-type N-terminal cleavage/methylation domain-containing protein [Candidatus Hydrogenedentota bacterium]
MKNKNGFTLVEVMLSIIFIAAACIPIYYALNTGFKANDNIKIVMKADLLLTDMMEEIQGKDFEDRDTYPGSFETEETSRVNYDDVDDYNNYGPYSPPTDRNGNAMSEYAGFSRKVEVNNIKDYPRSDYAFETPGSTGSKLVTIRVIFESDSSTFTRSKIFTRE